MLGVDVRSYCRKLPDMSDNYHVPCNNTSVYTFPSNTIPLQKIITMEVLELKREIEMLSNRLGKTQEYL